MDVDLTAPFILTLFGLWLISASKSLPMQIVIGIILGVVWLAMAIMFAVATLAQRHTPDAEVGPQEEPD